MISFPSHSSGGVGGHKVFEMVSFSRQLLNSVGAVGGHKVFETFSFPSHSAGEVGGRRVFDQN
jgi:hypothetical protein